MDAKMASTTPGTFSTFPTWDFAIVNGACPLLTGDDESVQLAAMAAYIQVGTIPQLPDVGVPWTEFLTGTANGGDLDAAIRKNVAAAGQSEYNPDYEIFNNQLVVTMRRLKTV